MFNHLALSSFETYSADSRPSGRVHLRSLATLEQAGIATRGLYSKDGEAFEGVSSDIVITACDVAAGEACPLYLGVAPRARWGLADSPALDGDEALRDTVFRVTLTRTGQCCRTSLGLPFVTLDRNQLKRESECIGLL